MALRVFAANVASTGEGEAMSQELTQGSHRAEAGRSSRRVEDYWSAAVCGVALLLVLTAIAALAASLF